MRGGGEGVRGAIAESPSVVPSFHKGGVRGGSCNLTDPQPPNLGGSRTDPQPPNLGGSRTDPQPPNLGGLGGDYLLRTACWRELLTQLCA